MEDEKFVRELKETIKGKKLPTLSDLGEGYKSPFDEMPDLDSKESQHKEFRKPITEKPAIIKVDKPKAEPKDKSKKDLIDKVESLHSTGKTIDEIYRILKGQGNSYDEIEEAILSLIKEEKTEPFNLEDDFVELKEPARTSNKEELAFDNSKSETKPAKEYDEDFAPLFVKVGKYKETLETLENLENYLNGMARLFELANELEVVRASNIAAMNKMFEKASRTASTLSTGLLKPRGMKIEGALESKASIDNLGEVISELNKELAILKTEIGKIKEL